MEVSLYEVLEVSPNAGPAVIKAAYRVLVQQNHPDKNPGNPAAAERLSLINQAYAVLADPLLKARYDKKRAASADRRGSGRGLAPAKADAVQPDAKLRPFAFRRFQ
ncbi:MAG: J domain-containing protein [Proteobacteria bacterium]|nr:J domain-containing protein [Pseudomonadota bacterium]